MENAVPIRSTWWRSASAWTSRYIMPLLLLVYLASALWPHAGQRLMRPLLGRENFRVVNIVLACLLFGLGLSTPLRSALGLLRESRWITLSLTIRATVGLALIFVMRFVPSSCGQLALALAFLMVLPTAASSSGWCIRINGSRSICIALITASTFFSAIGLPLLMLVAERAGPSDYSEQFVQLRHAFSPWFVLPWVIGPMLMGMIVASAGERFVGPLRNATSAIAPFLLLVLNYANGAASLPALRENGVTKPMALGALVCIVVLLVLAGLVAAFARALGARRDQRDALWLGTCMSNTGLGLVVAVAAVPQATLVHVVIIVYTFVQHLSASMMSSGNSQDDEIKPRG